MRYVEGSFDPHFGVELAEVLCGEPEAESVLPCFREFYGEVVAFAGEVLEFMEEQVVRFPAFAGLGDPALYCANIGDGDAADEIYN